MTRSPIGMDNASQSQPSPTSVPSPGSGVEPAAAFALDTSGVVPAVGPTSPRTPYWPERKWSDLTPFCQGFIRAMFGSLRFFHLECPSCEWDCIVGPPTIADAGLTCPLCAGDNGRDVYLRSPVGDVDLPAKVEGHDARSSLRFDMIASAALERIVRECGEIAERTGWPRLDELAGRQAWRLRQESSFFYGLTPVFISLDSEGKVIVEDQP